MRERLTKSVILHLLRFNDLLSFPRELKEKVLRVSHKISVLDSDAQAVERRSYTTCEAVLLMRGRV